MKPLPLRSGSFREELMFELLRAEAEAWKSLARYKFQMFGYWAAIWVHLNRVGKFGYKNPFKSLVKSARVFFPLEGGAK